MPAERPDRLRIARAYESLMAKGYFSDGIGGNEGYLGDLLLSQVPADARSILEVGGGTGLWLDQVLRRRPALREVTVVEISKGARRCRERLAPLLDERPGGRLDVIEGDFLEVAGGLGPAQVVASSFVAEYMGDPAAYLRQLHDLTVPGGRVVMVDVLTGPRTPAGQVPPVAVLGSFLRLCWASILSGRVPPVLGVARSLPLYRFADEPAFRDLHADYTAGYEFPRATWEAERRRYPGAIFRNLGIAGMLVLPKPA